MARRRLAAPDPGGQQPEPGDGGFTLPPPKEKTKPGPPSAQKRADALFREFPGWRKYWGTVKNAANRWGTDPMELLALLIFENTGADPAASSPAGAIGLAQIFDNALRKDLNPAQYASFLREWGEITPERKRNPAYSIHYAAWRMAGTRWKYGSLDEWYRSPGYNPGFQGDSRGPGPSIYIGRYQPETPQRPEQEVGEEIETAGVKTDITDPFVAIRKGKVIGVENPNRAVKTFGLPLRRSEWERLFADYNDYFQAYWGQDAKPGQVASLIKRGIVSEYAITRTLAKAPNFFKSPVWKAKGPSYESIAQQILGPQVANSIDRNFYRNAIIDNLDGAAFGQRVRERPEYLKGNEFKQSQASLQNVYQSIYGVPGQNAKTTIKEAAVQQWSPDQFAAWLRSQENYTTSPEYRTRALSFLEQLGMITGDVPVLVAGPPPDRFPQQPGIGPLPDSPRITGSPRAPRSFTSDLGNPTLGA